MLPGRDREVVAIRFGLRRPWLSHFGRGRDVRWRRDGPFDRRDRCPFCQNGSVGYQTHMREHDVGTRRDRFPGLRGETSQQWQGVRRAEETGR
ncbi:hypothetical protein Taro_022541 [Colocasia esculenta]|uniref:Uncharacterized protein n=1 Tax=Colocasia esculenta TaxID=4460 RepID=A0A843UUQ9_COLES|nr:hypothetical protein [Colocasia esculenta]